MVFRRLTSHQSSCVQLCTPLCRPLTVFWGHREVIQSCVPRALQALHGVSRAQKVARLFQFPLDGFKAPQIILITDDLSELPLDLSITSSRHLYIKLDPPKISVGEKERQQWKFAIYAI